MFLSRFCMPYQNHRTAESRYALHEATETPAAWWPSQIVRTCGMVISRVNTDMPPRSRRSVESCSAAEAAGVVGSKAIVDSWRLHAQSTRRAQRHGPERFRRARRRLFRRRGYRGRVRLEDFPRHAVELERKGLPLAAAGQALHRSQGREPHPVRL